MAGLEFDIRAEVSSALANLKRIQSELSKTGDTATKTAPKFEKFSKSVGGANTTLFNFGRVVQDAPFGLIGIANNIDPLISSFQQLKIQTGSTGAAFKALFASLAGPAGIAIAVSAVTSLLIAYGDEIKEAVGGTSAFAKAIDEAAEGAASNAIKVNILTEAVKSGTLSASEQAKAQKELIKINPQFKGAFDGGALSVGKLDKALQSTNARLFEQIKISAATNILQKEFEKLAATVAKGGETSFFQKLQSAATGFQFFDKLEKFTKEKNLTEAQQQIEDFGKRINEVFGALNISFSEYVTNYDAGSEKQKKKIKEVAHEFERLAEIQLKSQFDPTKFGQLPTQAPTEPTLNQSTEQIIANTERLKFLLKSVNYDKQIAQAEKLRGILDNGINGAVDQFFNALANNQNPFEALLQSLKRLIVELGIAVIKAFALKALTTGLTAGTGGAAQGLLAGLKGIGGFATGGFVTQPTLSTIAENGPEFVLRPDQLGAIMNMGGGGGGFVANPVIRGEDIVLVMNRVNNRKGRNF